MTYEFRLNYFLILLLLFFSCSKKVEIENKNRVINIEDKEIYNLVFNDLIGHDSISREILNFYNEIQNKEEVFFYPSTRKKYEESFNDFTRNELSKNEIDSAQLFVYVENKLLNVKEQMDISNIISKDNFKYNFTEVDVAFIPLLKELNNYNDTINFDVSILNTDFNYNIIPSTLDFKEDKNKLLIGQVSFSKIIYNKSNNIACVYTHNVCGGECGGGYIMFLKKISNKWVLTSKKLLWVA